MAEEKETLVVTLGRENGYVAVSMEFNDGKSEPKKNNEKEDLRVSHMQNVLNHFGEKGWIFEKISSDEKTLRFYRAKQGFISRLFGRKTIRHRIRNIYKDKKTGKFEVGADLPFGEISSFEGLYVDSIKEAIGYISKKYGYIFLFQSPEKEFTKEFLIKLYFCRQ